MNSFINEVLFNFIRIQSYTGDSVYFSSTSLNKTRSASLINEQINQPYLLQWFV